MELGYESISWQHFEDVLDDENICLNYVCLFSRPTTQTAEFGELCVLCLAHLIFLLILILYP